MEQEIYDYNSSLKKSIEYFNGDKLAAKVFLDKYALRDNNQNLLEDTPEKMHIRIASELARIEKKKFKNPMSFEEILSYLQNFKKIVPQGSMMYGIGNPYQFVTLSNCFAIEPPLDSYSGILHADQQMVQICKRRGGVGTDISNLRPDGTPTTNAARTSTGIISFMERYSNSIREVAQNGRRGAILISISVHHPEILKFTKAKKDLTKITGANISIRLTDEFLEAVEKNKD
ncbi:MAG TPA: ribonucleotide reductase N-terminal alpha domain-containing protein, partial [Candidatus Glassbacteria bacterium]|nr:ribonucleotide reductase N-terminal alpha domain-containing protein [Candidatus Glassbacteria bacterium]